MKWKINEINAHSTLFFQVRGGESHDPPVQGRAAAPHKAELCLRTERDLGYLESSGWASHLEVSGDTAPTDIN